MQKLSYMIVCLALPFAMMTMGGQEAHAQDFLGGFNPNAGKNSSASQTSKPKAGNRKNVKAVSLPDKPNKVDAQGRKQGEWAAKYPNGRYKYAATFRDGRPVGKVTRYDETGMKYMTLTYTKSDTVKATTYHRNRKISAKGQYLNEKREGYWRFYREDGTLIETASYSGGKLHGKRCFYFNNGNLMSVCTWVDSLREGPYVKYFISGAKEITATFSGDELNGTYTSWGADGKITSQGEYRNGVTVGKWHMRYPEANVEGDIIYDSHGIIINRAAADSLEMRRQQYYDKNKGKIKDPQDYMNNPEMYMSGSPQLY